MSARSFAAQAKAVARSGPTVATPAAGTAEYLGVALCAAAGCVLLSLALGRDLNWDYLNYHGYAALSLLQDRLTQDFWPAGVPGYLNPLPFLPLALMQAAGWPSAVVASVLALIQSLGLVALYGLSRHLAGPAPHPRAAATVMTLLGAATATYVAQIGSTFIDATTAPLVMLALWLLVAGRSVRAMAVAAALVGAATALKWTNAPFAVGLLAAAGLRLWLLCGHSPAGYLRAAVLVCAAMAAGFALCYGWWALRLHQAFGSPVFPLFNGIFQSPDSIAESASYQRFVPQTLAQWVSLPWRMVEHKAWVYTEVMAPDIRPLLLLFVAPLAATAVALRRGAAVSVGAAHAAVVPLTVFMVVSTALWVVTSTNGRYAVPLLLLLGPLLYLAFRALLGPRRALMFSVVLLLAQTLHAAAPGNPRWSPMRWSDAWMPVTQIPEMMRAHPMLFVVVGTVSESYLATVVHPDSAFVNPIGVVSLRSNGPGWDRFVALRDRHVGRTQVVFALNPYDNDGDMRRKAESRNPIIDRLALTLDSSACQRLVFNAQHDPAVLDRAVRRADVYARHLASCPAAPLSHPSAALADARMQATEIMDAYEARCPAMLSPRQTQVEGGGARWERYYGKFDLFLTLDLATGQITMRQERQVLPVQIGRAGSWRDDVQRFACRLPHSGARDISTMEARP